MRHNNAPRSHSSPSFKRKGIIEILQEQLGARRIIGRAASLPPRPEEEKKKEAKVVEIINK